MTPAPPTAPLPESGEPGDDYGTSRRHRLLAARNSNVERLARILLFAGATWVIYQAMHWIAPILTPILISLLIAYFLDPLIDRFETWRVSRTLAIVFVAVLGVGAIVLFAFLIVPTVLGETVRALQSLPEWSQAQYDTLRAWSAERFEVDLDARILDSGVLEQGLAYAQSVALRIALSVMGSLTTLLNLVLIPIFTFYFLRDFDTLKLRPLRLVPPRHRDEIRRLGREIDQVVGAWLRGQVRIAMVLAVFYAIALWISGVPSGPFIGIVAGLLNIIPYFGVLIGVVLSLLMVLVTESELPMTGPLIGIAITFVVAGLLDDYVLKPKMLGDQVGMSPLTVMVVLFLGGALFGFYGVMLSIPVAAAGGVVAKWGLQHYFESDFFVGTRSAGGVSDPDADTSLPEAVHSEASTADGVPENAP